MLQTFSSWDIESWSLLMSKVTQHQKQRWKERCFWNNIQIMNLNELLNINECLLNTLRMSREDKQIRKRKPLFCSNKACSFATQNISNNFKKVKNIMQSNKKQNQYAENKSKWSQSESIDHSNDLKKKILYQKQNSHMKKSQEIVPNTDLTIKDTARFFSIVAVIIFLVVLATIFKKWTDYQSHMCKFINQNLSIKGNSVRQ